MRLRMFTRLRNVAISPPIIAMKIKCIFQGILFSLTIAAAPGPLFAQGELPPVFTDLELVDEVDCSKAPTETRAFVEYPEKISRVDSILKGKARVLPNDQPGLKYFSYRLGKGKNLEAGAAYVLEIEYPEDAPRSLIVINQGAEITRGFHTGLTIGDALKARRVNNLPESLDLPLSGKFEKWQMLFHLHDHFPDLKHPRSQEFPRDQKPADGFRVIIAQFEPENAPLSKGAAISKIRLYKAPAFDKYALKLNLPPKDLPSRQLFCREEMGDSIIERNPAERGVDIINDWYVYKARLCRFLGMNTLCKDLLEYGHNQGWDSRKYGGEKWMPESPDPERWNRMVDTANEYGLNVLPYYEFSGSKGIEGLGVQRRAIPLGGRDMYTGIKWLEATRADLTDPDTFEDFRKMLEITIADLKGHANFIGAWIRPRMAQMPMGFSDSALKQFATDTAQKEPVTRPRLQENPELYAAYKQWWFGKRREFLNRVRDYVREASGNPKAVVLYSADHNEPARVNPDPRKAGLVAESPDVWRKAGYDAASLAEASTDHRHFEALTLPAVTSGTLEMQHAAPEYDPQNYRNNEGVLPTFTFNRAWTVADADALEAFRTPSGLAMIRHYSLNEDMLREDTDAGPVERLGFFVCDMELAGPYCMLAEARAMANGDPDYLGYHASSTFNRGFPQYVRDFDAAYLALPAIPSKRLEKVAEDPEIVVRRMDAGDHGVYYAVINTGYHGKKSVHLNLPDKGVVVNAATGEKLTAGKDGLVVNLRPCQLLALQVTPEVKKTEEK